MIEPKDFLAAIDDDRVTVAIQAAESRTSAEFRVFVAHNIVDYPVTAAAEQFERMHMHATQRRNAVLIFIAPKSQNFALFADTAAHAKVGQPVFERLSKEMGEHFKRSGYTEGIVHVLESLASTLAEHFPIQPDDRDELSNSVERG